MFRVEVHSVDLISCLLNITFDLTETKLFHLSWIFKNGGGGRVARRGSPELRSGTEVDIAIS